MAVLPKAAITLSSFDMQHFHSALQLSCEPVHQRRLAAHYYLTSVSSIYLVW